jgi:hypothetical protein
MLKAEQKNCDAWGLKDLVIEVLDDLELAVDRKER